MLRTSYSFKVTVPPELNGGKRGRKFFHARKAAQQFADDLRARRENSSTRLA